MRKYLMTALAAVAFGAAFVSCTHSDDVYSPDPDPTPDPVKQKYTAELIKSEYNALFEKTFGKVGADVDWGFNSNVAATRAYTRSYTRSWNGWASAPDAADFATDIPNDAVEFSDATYGQGNVQKKFYLSETTDEQRLLVSNGNFIFYISGTKKVNFVNPADAADNMIFYVLPNANLTFTNYFNLQKPQNFKMYIASKATVTFAAGENSNIKMYNKGTVYVNGSEQCGVYGQGLIYNEGTMEFNSTKENWDASIPPYGANISGALVIHNDKSQIVNAGTITTKGLRVEGSGHFRNLGTMNVNGITFVNSNSCSWINDGTYNTTDFRYTAGSTDVFNNCSLNVSNEFSYTIGDSSSNSFQINGGGSVVTKNFSGSGPFKIEMGSKALFKVTNDCYLDATAAGIATSGYGFHGVGVDYAVLQAKNVTNHGNPGHGYVAYGGKLYVSAESHFAQGTAGAADGASYIIFMNGCSEANIYAPGFKDGKPAITITPSGCNPGFEGGGSNSKIYRVIVEDLNANESGNDFDFNDAVFDVYKKENGEWWIRLRAAGGIYPLTVDGEEVHAKFGATVKADGTYDMLNTGAKGGGIAEADLPTWKCSKQDISNARDIDAIPVYVTKPASEGEIPTINIQLYAEKGGAACKILVDGDYTFCKERTGISTDYPKFDEYVSGNNAYSRGEKRWWAD